MKITSAALLWLGWLSSAGAQPGQDNSIITPRFVPAAQGNAIITPRYVPAPKQSDAVPVHFAEPKTAAPPAKTTPTATQAGDKGMPRSSGDVDDDGYIKLPLDLPGPQGLFGRRESEASFYMRIGQAAQRNVGRPAIFPKETPVSKDTYKSRDFPPRVAQVEPLYLLHRRLLFEQPNFERGLWDFGIIQPAISLSVFYYDMAMLPYHFYSDWHDRSEANLGKCIPGDPAPLRVPIERFSVTGAIGEVGVIVGGGYLFP